MQFATFCKNYYFGKKMPSKLNWFESMSRELKLMFIENYATNGYCSANIMRHISRGHNVDTFFEKMGVANYRHNYTNYDSIDKSNLADYQVRELRMHCNCRGEK